MLERKTGRGGIALKCPNCKTEMEVVGYIQIRTSYNLQPINPKSKGIPAKWKCPRCGLIIDAL